RRLRGQGAAGADLSAPLRPREAARVRRDGPDASGARAGDGCRSAADCSAQDGAGDVPVIAVVATRQTVESTARAPALRLLFALPGLHRVVRGAEVAFESLGAALAERGCEVTLVGSGEPRPGRPYRFLHAGCTPRERFMSWPRVPVFRSHYAYEDATFASQLWHVYRP